MDTPSTHASLFVPLEKGEQSLTAWAAFHSCYDDVILTWCRRRELSSACVEDVAWELGLSVEAVHEHSYRVKQMLQEEYLHVHLDEPGAHLPGRDDPEAVSHGRVGR
jgi:hypothetical protein